MAASKPNILLVVDNAIEDVMADQPSAPTLSGGGGDGTSDRMEARVTALETDMRSIRETLIRIETKLDTKASSAELTELKVKLDSKASTNDVIELKGKIEAKASTSDVSTLAGKVSQLPTTLQLLGFVLAIFVASGLVKHFFP